MNSADIIVMAGVAMLALLAAGIMRRNRRKGKRGCGCQCPGCCDACGKNISSRDT